MSRAVGRDCFHSQSLDSDDLCDRNGQWVKVAYSPTLRRAGELLNFFPGQYPGGIPNAPSPLAAMLTSGLVGAGLGWGGGKLLSTVLPEGFGSNLGSTGAIVGGALGTGLGGVYAGANLLTGRSLTDGSLFDSEAGSEPVDYADAVHGTNQPPVPIDAEGPHPLEGVRERLESSALPKMKHWKLPKFGSDLESDLAAVVLGTRYRSAVEKVASTFGRADTRRIDSSLDVNIDALGRTLWDSGASPALAATTMASMYAARQLPDPASRPGIVTVGQLGQLAANAVGDYGRGALVGAALNAIVGTPLGYATFGYGAAALGVIGTVVPKLFGA